MVVETSIVGGYLKIQKSVFVREMLSKESRLRALLNWRASKDFADRHPEISEPDEDNVITVRFDSEASVDIGESPKEFLGDLKAKHKEKIKGKLACRTVYAAFGGIFNFEIDLNFDGDKIDYIMN